MSEITLNELPNEIIIKIVKYLVQRALRNATLTCKRWKILIESSCRWSMELRHNDRVGYLESCMKFMLTTNRKFSTMKLFDTHPTDKLLELFHGHCLNIIKLQLERCQMIDFRFAELLKCMPNLEHVIIAETFGKVINVTDQILPELKQLHTLEIVFSTCSIIQWFKRAKLSTAKFGGQFCQRSVHCSLNDFLKSQNTLTSLTMECVSPHDASILFRTESLKNPMPFHLTHLSLRSIVLRDVPHDHLLQFLKSQAQSLKEIEFGRNFPSSFLQFAFAQMTHLETLNLTTDEIPQEKEFHEQLMANRSITNFRFLAFHGFGHALDIFKKLPNIHTLFIDGYCGIPALLAVQGVQLHNLKTLGIRYLMGKIDWSDFTKVHPRLTNFTVEKMKNESYLNSDDLHQITTNVGLQSLRLGRRFLADKRFSHIVRENCPDLKVLHLHKSCVSDELMYNINCKVLRFYDDATVRS